MKKILTACLIGLSAIALSAMAIPDKKTGENKRSEKDMACCCDPCDCRRCLCDEDCYECRDCHRHEACRNCRSCYYDGYHDGCCADQPKRRHSRGGCCGRGC